MTRAVCALLLSACAGLALVSEAALSQDLVVSNARIVTGTGRTVERGSVVVRDGRIAAVSAARTETGAALRLDARGMTVLPGFIDTHRHVMQIAVETEAELAAFAKDVVSPMLETLLEMGFTTIFSMGDPVPQILELREQLERGEVRGPRLFSVGMGFTGPNGWPTQVCAGVGGCLARSVVQTASPPEAAARVAELAARGVDGIKVTYDTLVAPGTLIDERVIAAIAAEASRHHLTVYAHITAMDEPALRLVDLGVRAFVHPMPLRTPASAGGAARLRELGIPVATTIGPFSAETAVLNGIPYSERNRAIFANWGAAVTHLAEAGVTLAFGTDSPTGRCVACDAPPTATLTASERARAEAMIEIRTLAGLLSNAATIEALTRNAAIFIGKGAELGTLEPGKFADLVIVEGDPLVDIGVLENVRFVVKAGRVVVDRR